MHPDHLQYAIKDLRMFTKRMLSFVFAAVLFSGCAANLEYAKSQGIKQVSSDVYEVFREDHRGVFGSESSLQNEVVTEANDFAERQGMIAIPIEAKQHRVGILGDWAWCYYKFRLSPKGDVRISKNASDVTFEGDARMSNNFLSTKSVSAKKNSYDELIKLDELRKKGILTEEEFQTQKKRLLE